MIDFRIQFIEASFYLKVFTQRYFLGISFLNCQYWLTHLFQRYHFLMQPTPGIHSISVVSSKEGSSCMSLYFLHRFLTFQFQQLLLWQQCLFTDCRFLSSIRKITAGNHDFFFSPPVCIGAQQRFLRLNSKQFINGYSLIQLFV